MIQYVCMLKKRGGLGVGGFGGGSEGHENVQVCMMTSGRVLKTSVFCFSFSLSEITQSVSDSIFVL